MTISTRHRTETASVRTDASGAFSTTIDIDRVRPRDRAASTRALRVVAYWRGPTGRFVFTRADVAVDNVDGGGTLVIRTSIRAPRLPGVPFSVIVDRRVGLSAEIAGTLVPGAPATVTATRIDAALCAALLSCDSDVFTARIDGTGGRLLSLPTALNDEPSALGVNATESALLRSAGDVICTRVAVSTDDWTACRYELPVTGVFALLACSEDGEGECAVTYRCV